MLSLKTKHSWGAALKRSGFDVNLGDNVRYLEQGFHGKHPQYTEIVAERLENIMTKNGGTLSVQDIKGVVNEMHTLINNAESGFKTTRNNLNEFSRQIRK